MAANGCNDMNGKEGDKMGFTITCDKCKGTDVMVTPIHNGEFIEVIMTCETCGQTNEKPDQ